MTGSPYAFPSRRLVLSAMSSLTLSACASGKERPTQRNSTSVSTDVTGWRSASPLPGARQEIYPCAHNGAIRLVGGFRGNGGVIDGPTRSHALYLADTQKWVTTNEIPIARHHMHMASFDGVLLAFGGFEVPSRDAAWNMRASGWVYQNAAIAAPGDLKPSFWRALPDLPVPCGEAVTGITGDGLLHLAGGRTPKGLANAAYGDHADTDHHFVLDRIAGTWQPAAPCLTKRNSATGDVIAGNLHIVGGRTVSGGNVATHEVYDPREDRWRMAAPMPQAQAGLAAAALDGKLYVFGGEHFDHGRGVYAESWVYDPTTDAWSALPDMPTPRHGLGAVAFEGEIFVIGGATQAGGIGTSAVVEVYRP